MTGQQIDRDRLRELAENATPGPWEADLDRHGETRGIWPTGPGEEQIIGSYVAADGYDSQGWTGGTDEDLAFIAAARTAVPALLDALDQAEAEVKRLSWKCGHLADKYAQDTDELRQEAGQAEAERDNARAQVDRVRALLDRMEGGGYYTVTTTGIRRALDGEQ